MKESTLLAMKNRLNDLTQESQFSLGKLNELEIVLSSLIKLVEKLPGYEEAKAEIVEENKKLLDESSELDIK